MKNLQQEIIGTLLTFPEEIHTVIETLTAEEFNGQYRQAFEFMAAEGGDIVSVAAATGIASTTLAQWMDGNGSRFHLKTYCKQLQEANTVQRIARIGSDLKGMAQGYTAAQMIEFAERSLLSVAPQGKKEPKKLGAALKELMNNLESRWESHGEVIGVTTGIDSLDNQLAGLCGGNLIIIAGRPSMGKTALAVNMAVAAAKNAGPTLVFSLEMKMMQLVERVLADMGNVDSARIRRGLFKEEDWPRITNAAGEMNHLPLYVDDSSGISLQEIKTKARKMKQQHGLTEIVVDYLTLMEIQDGPQRSVAIGSITRGLKGLAKELDVPVILLCQLSRRVDERQDKRPIMSDLRDSGEIEQDADVIIFPFRESAYCAKCRDKINDAEHSLKRHQRKAELIIAKDRNGTQNVSIPAEFYGEYQRFKACN